MKKILSFLFLLCVLISSRYYAQNCLVASATDTNGNQNPVIDCNYSLVNQQNCLTLTVDYPKIYATDTYTVSSENYQPYIPYNSGTPINANFDDVFPQKVDLPFTFCFFGNYYNQVIIGSNGLLTFDSSQLGNVSYPNIQANNPNVFLPKNSIFGVLHDLVFSSTNDSEIYYSVIGTAPCRKFVLNFYKGRLSGCPNQLSTLQIVLNESSNEIEVFVEEKPLPCATAKFSESLIGIINSNGTIGYSPPGRNTGIWTATNEAWKFSPSGQEIIPQFQWMDSNNQIIGNTRNVQVCPNENTNYKVEVTYNTCNAATAKITDDIPISFASDFPLAKDYTHYFCNAAGNSQNINLSTFYQDLTPQIPSNLSFSFHSTLSDAQTGSNNLPLNQTVSANTIIYVRIENPSDPNCFRTSKLEFRFVTSALLTQVVQICDLNGDGVENNYPLSLLNAQLVGSGFTGNIVYFLNQNDAQNNTNPVTTANLSASVQLWIRMNVASCSQILGPITLNMNQGPVINTPIQYNVNICDFKNDGAEPFGFQSINQYISTDLNLVFEYYSTYQLAYAGTTPEIDMISEGQYSIFVRVEDPIGGCFSIAEVQLNVVFDKVEAQNQTEYICFNGTDDKTFDLSVLSDGMLINPLTGITQTYFDNYYNAVDGNAIFYIPTIQDITDDGNYVSKTFYIRFQNAAGCYTIRELTIALVHPAPAKSDVFVCDINNDGSERITLADFDSQFAGNQSATITYFLQASDANANTNSVSGNYDLTNAITTLYIRLEMFGCVEVYPVKFNLTAVPVIQQQVSIVQQNICDNNSDGVEAYDLTQLQNQIYSGANAVNFNYYTQYNSSTGLLSGQISDPTQYLASANSTVYVQVLFANGNCFSVSTVNIINHFLPLINLHDNIVLRKCDYDFNLYESFNLNDATSGIFVQSENSLQLSDMDITYYKTETEANDGLAGTRISSIQVTEHSEVTVWARFQSRTLGCFSVVPILLKTYLPPKAIVSTITVCDNNLDQSAEVDLTSYTSQMVDIVNPDYVFSFYRSQSDAMNSQNAIANPENFSENPFPTRIWVRIEVIPGCFDTAPIDFVLGTKVTLQNTGPFAISVCDDGNDGTEILDLTQFENTILPGASFEYFATLNDLHNQTNLIQNPANYQFDSSNGTSVYVKVSSPNFCPEMVLIHVDLKSTPIFTLPEYFYCPYNEDSFGSVDIQPDFSGLDIVAFEWKDPSGNVVSTSNELLGVNVSGTYTISVIAGNTCTYTTTFEVKSYEVPIITEIIPNGNSYTVIATGSKRILYSIDGIIWQYSNVFNQLQPGVVTFYVKFDNENCIGLTKQGLILNIRNVFTPNADGYNDVWYIDDLYVFEGQKANVQIFDQYGSKVFEQESSSKIEWNGFLGGRKLSTSSYWYVLSLPDGRKFTGWIVLKNRN